jgi:hypothetical protein
MSMNPTEKHITFARKLWDFKVNLKMVLLVNAFPNPDDLPDIEYTLWYVHQCRTKGYEPNPDDVLNGIPLEVPFNYDFAQVILGNRPSGCRNRIAGVPLAVTDEIGNSTFLFH